MTLTIMDRKLFLAPIGDSPQRAIDLGTGTGIWAVDFGKIEQQYILRYNFLLIILQVNGSLLQR